MKNGMQKIIWRMLEDIYKEVKIMKKLLVFGVLFIMACSVSACSDKSESGSEAQKESVDIVEEEKDTQEQEETKADSDNKDEENEDKPVLVNVYSINDSDGTVVVTEKECETVNEQVIWDMLKEAGVLQEESEILSLKQENEKLFIDVNNAFGEQLRSLGTAGEIEMLGCVVNTYLEAYQCDGIKITEEGETLYSGHAEYSDYLTKFE